MKLSFPMTWFNRPKSAPLTPEQIRERASRSVERIEANIEARTEIDKARQKRERKSVAGMLVRLASGVMMLAAVAIVAAGYLYDILFYGQQSTDVLIVTGLIIFAAVARTCAWAIPIAIDATKRREEGESDDVGKHIEINRNHRTLARLIFIGAITVCSIATVSFFIHGHDTATQEDAGYASQEAAWQASIDARKRAIEEGLARAAAARDEAVRAADTTIDGIKDEVPTVSAADNVTIRAANASKDVAQRTYTDALTEANAKLESLAAEVFVPVTTQGVVVERHTARPFQAVYRLFASAIGTETAWAKALGLFFAAMFELFCAGLAFMAVVLGRVLPRAAQAIDMRHSAEQVAARIQLDRMQADIEFGKVRLAAELEAERLRAQIEQTQFQVRQAKEQADAEIDLARSRREIEKARLHAAALAEGKPWVDPDEMLEAEADRQRALQFAHIRELTEIAERLRSGDLSINDVDEMGNLRLTPEQRRIKKAQEAKNHYAQAAEIGIPLPASFEGRA